ncbi:hypothetical protein V1281_005141 [Nitrobacteraceae bacterium AZCC 2161]
MLEVTLVPTSRSARCRSNRRSLAFLKHRLSWLCDPLFFPSRLHRTIEDNEAQFLEDQIKGQQGPEQPTGCSLAIRQSFFKDNGFRWLRS